MRTNNIYSLKLITFHWLNVNIDIADRDSINCVLLYIFLLILSVCLSACLSVFVYGPCCLIQITNDDKR